MTPEQIDEARAAAESARAHCPGLPRRMANYLIQALDEIDYLRSGLEGARAEIARLAPYERFVLDLYENATLEALHPGLDAQVRALVEGTCPCTGRKPRGGGS